MKRLAAILLLFASPLLAQTNVFQVAHQYPDTSLQFDVESGLPTATETQVDIILTLNHETGLPVNKSGAQPKPPPTTDELGGNESTKIQPVAGGIFNLLKRIGRQPFPFQFIGGWRIPLNPLESGRNLAISYLFSKEMELREQSGFHISFNWHPRLTLGLQRASWSFLVTPAKGLSPAGYGSQSESITYGMVEEHVVLAMANMRASLFLGAGAGRYRTFSAEYNDQGIDVSTIPGSGYDPSGGGYGPVLSAGAQLESRRLMYSLRYYRTPGFGRLVTFMNLGYNPQSYKEAFIVVPAVSLALFLIFEALPN